MEYDYELCETLKDIPTFKGVDLVDYASLQQGTITYLPRINATPLEKKNVIKIYQTKFLRILDQDQHKEWIQEMLDHLYRLQEDNVIQISNEDEKCILWTGSGIDKGIYQELDLVGEGLEGIRIFNESTEVIIKDVFAEFIDQIRKNNSYGVNFKSVYKISIVGFAEGATTLPIALISLGREPVQFGTQELFLKPIGEDTKNILKEKPIYDSCLFREGVFRKELLKKFGMTDKIEGESESTKDVMKLWDEFLDLCYEQTYPVPIEELKNCTHWKNVQDMAISGGVTIDSKLKTAFKAASVIVNPKKLLPEEYMPFAPNQVIITNSKTGKSSTAARISPNVIRDATVANLLGFSDMDKVHHGLLHGQIFPTYLDEMTESVEVEVSNGLSSYMEAGSTHRARGLGVRVQGYSPLIFMANPRVFDQKETTQEIYEEFSNTLTYITGNPIALGSRLGILIFDSNLKTVEGERLESEKSKNSLKVLKTVQYYLRDTFSELFKNKQVLSWLNTPYSKNFKDEVIGLSQNIPTNMLREFYRGFLDSYRHVRGTALHIVFYENFENYIKDEAPAIKDLIVECEDQFIQLCEWNLESLREIASVKLDDSIIQGMAERAPEYVQLFLSLYTVYNKNGADRIPFENLEEGFQRVRPGMGRYNYFSNIAQSLTKNINQTNLHLEKFGLELSKHDDLTLVKVVNQKACERIENILINSNNVKVSGVSGVNKATAYDTLSPYSHPPHPLTLEKTQGEDKKQSTDTIHPTHPTHPGFSLKEIVLRTIRDPKNDYPKGVPIHQIIKVADTNGYQDQSVVRSTVDKLKIEGQILEPKTPGIYKNI